MTLGQTKALSLTGLQGNVVTVEVHISSGLPAFTLIGLPDTALNEARDRVRAATSSCGIPFPARRVTVNLAPAALPKSGSGFDLAIAIAVLSAGELISVQPSSSTVFLGELGLDGSIHPVRGALPVVLAARERGFSRIVIARENAAEARLIDGIEVVEVSHLAQVASMYGAKTDAVINMNDGSATPVMEVSRPEPEVDLSDVIGQHAAKFALEVAAAGGHNLFMVGPPGTGKSMLAARLSTILPELTTDQALEVASIKSLSGTLGSATHLSTKAPFESPHHTATAAALIGGGSGGGIKPGSVSRAHRGVLFLDETPEFSARVLQTLRQPMEHGVVSIARAAGTALYPAKFQLIAAANPCPCGNAYGTGMRCVCSSLQQRRYMQRLSGPLLDRIDLQVDVLPINSAATVVKPNESSALVRDRVIAAREAARARMRGTEWLTNSEVSGSWIRSLLGSSNAAVTELNKMVDAGLLSMRGADRVLRVAWTLADLKAMDCPTLTELHEAVTLRTRIGTA